MEPFQFALQHGFDAFEWFADKKPRPGGGSAGWEEADIDAGTRAWVREAGKAHDVCFTVHAPWQANPLYAEGAERLSHSIDFAHDIGAGMVNLHLYMEEGAEGYAAALTPVIRHAMAAGLRLSIENTPHTTPADFNHTFALLAAQKVAPPGAVGMCLDIGHANLCQETRNDFLRYMDLLSFAVPIIHLHVHENYGDADSHLTLFTGPSRFDDRGIRGFLRRLRRRDYGGVMILEQWPNPPELLIDAARRLRTLLKEEPGIWTRAPEVLAKDNNRGPV